MPIQWRTQYDGSEHTVTDDTAVLCTPEEDHAVQSEKDNADINVLMKRFGLFNQPLPAAATAAYFGDFTQVSDYQTALDHIREADEAFDALPGDLRSRFSNDPAQLIMFLENPDNRAEAVTLGLLNAPPQPATTPATPSPSPTGTTA